jgi:hypothetical protein
MSISVMLYDKKTDEDITFLGRLEDFGVHDLQSLQYLVNGEESYQDFVELRSEMVNKIIPKITLAPASYEDAKKMVEETELDIDYFSEKFEENGKVNLLTFMLLYNKDLGIRIK